MKLIAYGKEVTDNASIQSELENFLEVDVLGAIDLYSQRSEGESITLDGIDEEDLVELQDDDGYIRVLSMADLLKEGNLPANRGDGDEPLVINDLVTIKETSRGVFKKFFRKFLIFRVRDKFADYTISELTVLLENKFMPEEGIFKCETPLELEEKIDHIPVTTKPILLLVHGTAVNTESTFGGLVTDGDKSSWDSLKEQYGENIYACEHKTLSKSPLDNALMIARVLPKNAIVHIISGSRGGLIGEILCLNQAEVNGETGFTKDEISVFEKFGGREKDLANIEALNKIFEEKNIKVERFVRVACPAAGTTLASGRLDVYFNIILNLIGLIPVLQGPVYKFIKSFLIALVKKKSDVSLLPGLEAMDHKSPFIKVMNNPSKLSNSELIVISGDALPRGGLLHAIKVKLIDFYFRDENDFIVNTAAMYGGIRRTKAYYFFHQHQSTNHFKYFSNPPTQRAMILGLKGEASKVAKFKQIEAEKAKEVTDILSRGATKDKNAPVAFLIPGIMGSKLKAQGKKVWVNLARLPFGAFNRLRYGANQLEAYDLMGSAYADFVEFLSQSHDVEPFPYDWRLSVELAAKELHLKLLKKMSETEKPIHLIAHSLGGVVVQLMYCNHRQTWDELVKRDGSKVLLLGSPLNGSHIIPQVMLRQEHFFKILHSLDIFHSQKELLAILMKYPGILELLPATNQDGKASDGFDYFDAELYKLMATYDKKFSKPTKTALKNALTVQRKIQADPIQGENVFYVAGKDKCTPAKLEEIEDRKNFGEKSFRLLGTARGDGRVTWDSVISKDFPLKTWYMNASHGDMCNVSRFFNPLLDLLRYGTTSGLSTKPIVERGVEDYFEINDIEPRALIGEVEYEKEILGVKHDAKAVAPPQTVKIHVTHGDLGNAKFPIAVGHHLGDGIVSAEKVIDNYMDNRLQNYLYSGLYPGKIATSLVVLNHKGHFEGTLILGIGDFGKLSKGELEQTFAHGLIDMVMKREELFNARKEENEPLPKVGISTLLIGSRYSGLSIDDSIYSLLNGLALANLKLSQLTNCSIKQVSEIEFIELYEDRAISAGRVVNRLLKNGHFQEFELGKPLLNKVAGRKQKIHDTSANDWWFRLQITEDDSRAESSVRPIKFVSITDRALSEVRIMPTQRILIDTLLQSFVKNSRFSIDLIKTLYALIVPNELKDFAADKRDVIILVDKKTAEYPWELLHDPGKSNKKPISVQSGMIRQLASTRFNGLINYTTENTAFILGNPKTPKKFSDLPGAESEARLVGNLLEQKGFNTVESYHENAEEAIIKLFKNDYKVIHIAGHGVIDPEDPLKSGVVLSNGIMITPAEIQQMKKVPEFVFINCCYSGSMAGDSIQNENANILAANLGTQFIEKGVRAVIVAGWAVDDSAAKTFSEVFYGEMLKKEKFGVAVQRARKATYLNHGNTNTWGAYQCYGDQFYELKVIGENHHKKTKESREFVHPKEALIEIRNIRSISDVRSSGEVERLLEKLDTIINFLPADWLIRTDISEALASAFYELRAYERSMHYFNLLRKSGGDEYTLLGMRNLSTLYMKMAISVGRNESKTKEDKAAIKEYVKQSEQLAEWLLNLGTTSYRYSLKAGNLKRKSLIALNKNARIRSLKDSRDNYRHAVNVNSAQNEGDNYYPLLNWLTIEELLEFYGVEKSPELNKNVQVQQMIEKSKEARLQKEKKEVGFWSLVSKGAFIGYELFEMSSKQDIAQQKILEMTSIYKNAWNVCGSVRKAENVLEHIRFILDTLENAPRNTDRKSSLARLKNTVHVFRTLYSSLSEVMHED